MAYLVKTTFDELAALTDEMELYDSIAFSTESPEELAYYNLNPCRYNLIRKIKLMYESDYTVAIGLIDGHCTVAKDIYILSGGNIEDEDSRIEGIKSFIEEYYDNYTEKNANNNVYIIVDP